MLCRVRMCTAAAHLGMRDYLVLVLGVKNDNGAKQRGERETDSKERRDKLVAVVSAGFAWPSALAWLDAADCSAAQRAVEGEVGAGLARISIEVLGKAACKQRRVG